MTREALKLALEALDAYDYGAARITIHEALAQPVQPVSYNCTVVDDKHPDGIPFKDWVQPVQEPSSVQQAYAMAQVCLDLHEALGCRWGDNPYLTIGQLKAAAQPPLPVQPQRPWVGLTDEDRQAAFESMPDMLEGFLKTWGWLHFAKALEQIVKEKNT